MNRIEIMQHTCNLEDWLKRCEQAKMLSIPAEFGPPVSFDEICRFIDGKHDPEKPFGTISCANRWLQQNLKPDWMWRWDCCAPYSIKSAMAHGKKPEISRFLEIDDPRFFDIAFEQSRNHFKPCVRPWKEAVMVAGYPVEFRVYSLADGFAVSNYYPQRPLGPEWEGHARACIALAQRLKPFVPGGLFTCDFLFGEDATLYFLEGGPPWGFGAHPCCFKPDNLVAGAIALENQNAT